MSFRTRHGPALQSSPVARAFHVTNLELQTSEPIRYTPRQFSAYAPIFAPGGLSNVPGTQMTIPTHFYDHRDYEIVVSQTPPYSQAAIYPTEPNLPPVDWQLVPIRAANVKGALDLAMRRINEAYARRADQAAASKAS